MDLNNLEKILLVDEKDNPKGYMPKIDAHRNSGTLHRAFSIFVCNGSGEMLIQKRNDKKYHFSGLWSNTCCSHQLENDRTIKHAAHRRLMEEFGFDTNLVKIIEFRYKANFKNGLSENEYDHVFVGIFNNSVNANSEEISEYNWINTKELKKDVKENPEKYTPWFKMLIEKEDGLLLDYERITKFIQNTNNC